MRIAAMVSLPLHSRCIIRNPPTPFSSPHTAASSNPERRGERGREQLYCSSFYCEGGTSGLQMGPCNCCTMLSNSCELWMKLNRATPTTLITLLIIFPLLFSSFLSVGDFLVYGCLIFSFIFLNLVVPLFNLFSPFSSQNSLRCSESESGSGRIRNFSDPLEVGIIDFDASICWLNSLSSLCDFML